jgi:hypothetical protein
MSSTVTADERPRPFVANVIYDTLIVTSIGFDDSTCAIRDDRSNLLSMAVGEHLST